MGRLALLLWAAASLAAAGERPFIGLPNAPTETPLLREHARPELPQEEDIRFSEDWLLELENLLMLRKELLKRYQPQYPEVRMVDREIRLLVKKLRAAGLL